ncbi:mCG145609, isoform CRA_a, partial [Mus musculus]
KQHQESAWVREEFSLTTASDENRCGTSSELNETQKTSEKVLYHFQPSPVRETGTLPPFVLLKLLLPRLCDRQGMDWTINLKCLIFKVICHRESQPRAMKIFFNS